MSYAIFEEVYQDAPVSHSVRVVQAALNEAFGKVTVDGDFGPKTKAGYAKWQRKLGYSGDDANGVPGVTSFSRLAARYVFEMRRSGSKPKTAGAEPAHEYDRVYHGGRVVNTRTHVMLLAAEKFFGDTFTLTQGSYNAGVRASAGTHDGGGVVDISTAGMSASTRKRAEQCLRRAGFAAWVRTPPAFSYHIHAVAIGDREMSSGARSQIAQWADDRNGLANHGPDPAPDPYPAWTAKYK